MPKNLLHKYVTLATLKRMLEGTIRMTQPSAFNDPFELLPEIVARKSHPKGPVSLSFDLRAPRREIPVAVRGQLTDDCTSCDFMSRQILDGLNQQVGILCLSKSPNSILMWSHYAEQYQGAVISFDADHQFFADQIGVSYVIERPMIPIETYTSGPIPLAELCNKSKEWQYEQEVRIARLLTECKKTNQVDGRGFPIFTADLPQDAIVSIALGERTAIAQQKEIYALVKPTAIGLTLSAVDNVGFGFRQERILFQGPLRNPMISPRTAHIFGDANSSFGELCRTLIRVHPASAIVNKIA
jgi:hypothetical protein